MKKTGQKTVSAASLKVYRRAAVAADKKLAAAELAVASDPSAENKAAVQQARAKACAASAKLGRGAASSAEEEGEVEEWSQQKSARQARTSGSVKKTSG